VVIVFTYLFTALYACRLRPMLALLLGWTMGSPPALLSWVLAVRLRSLGVPLDWPTLLLVAWQLLPGLPLGLLVWKDEEPPLLAQYSLLVSSAACAWLFAAMDEWTLWLTLLFLVLWDLFAVLSPAGPINYILRLAQEWVYMGDRFDLPSGLSYTRENFTLGSGDLVFYACAFARGCMVGPATALGCLVAILVGFSLTAVAAMASDRPAVPALPIVVLLATAVYFASLLAAEDMLRDFARAGVML